MALDTAAKRFAFMSASSPVGGHLVVPDGANGKLNRFALMHIYGFNIVTVIPVTITSAGVIGSGIIGKDTL